MSVCNDWMIHRGTWSGVKSQMGVSWLCTHLTSHLISTQTVLTWIISSSCKGHGHTGNALSLVQNMILTCTQAVPVLGTSEFKVCLYLTHDFAFALRSGRNASYSVCVRCSCRVSSVHLEVFRSQTLTVIGKPVRLNSLELVHNYDVIWSTKLVCLFSSTGSLPLLWYCTTQTRSVMCSMRGWNV